MPLDRSGHISGLETGSFSIEKAATHPRGRTLAGRPWPHAADFGRLSVLKSDRGRKEAIRDREAPVCTLRGRRSDCRALVNRCTLERCDP